MNTDDDKEVWPKVIRDLECTNHNPFSPQGEELDKDAKAEFIKELKHQLGI